MCSSDAVVADGHVELAIARRDVHPDD